MTQQRWTVLKALTWTVEHFRRKGMENPRLDAEVLLAHLLGIDRVGLYLNYDRPLKEVERQAYREMIQRRTAWEPVAYIVGYKEFWSLRFKVNPDCLIPRPETEHLVEEALRIGREMQPPLRILEIGIGSGTVAVAVATELEEAMIVATDISSHAIALARENAQEHGVEGRIRFVHGDLFPPGEPPFSLIVSNPPYIPTEEILHLAPEVRDYEPAVALDGGEDGLCFFRKIAQGAPGYLVGGGWLLLEIREGQTSDVTTILEKARFTNIGLIPDYAGVSRVIRAQRR